MESEQNIYPPTNPFEKIKLCGNVIGVKRYIFASQGYVPMIINKSENGRPSVWFYAKSTLQQKIIPIVEDNRTKHNLVKCRDEGDRLIFNIQNPHNKQWVTFFKMIISKQYIPEVEELDLRPLGVNIHGANDELFIGNVCLSRNVVIGSDIFFEY